MDGDGGGGGCVGHLGGVDLTATVSNTISGCSLSSTEEFWGLWWIVWTASLNKSSKKSQNNVHVFIYYYLMASYGLTPAQGSWGHPKEQLLVKSFCHWRYSWVLPLLYTLQNSEKWLYKENLQNWWRNFYRPGLGATGDIVGP